MNIEEAIKQGKPMDEYTKLTVNLLYTTSWLSSNLSDALKPLNISVQQYNVLRILKGQHPNVASVKLLTERMLDKMSNASRLVDKLKEKGLVERRECPVDRRKVDVKILEKGVEILEQANKKVNERMESLRNNLGESDAAVLNRLLDNLRG